MDTLRQVWSKSKLFRGLMIVAILWFVIRLLFQIAYQSSFGEEWFLADDLQVYKLTSERLLQHEQIYRSDEVLSIEYFQYTPAFALLFSPLTRLPIPVLSVGWTVIQLALYYFLWDRWRSIFKYLELHQAGNVLLRLLPLWLFFSQFWADVAFGNIYILMALLSTLLIETILKRRLALSIILVGLILLTKPQCAFALVIPVFQRDLRFLVKIILGSGLVYLASIGLTMAAVGSTYTLFQYSAYFQFLGSLNSYYPWDKLPFLGYNHSILQSVIHYLGIPFSKMALGLTALIKFVFLAPIVDLSWRFSRRSQSQANALILALCWYLGVFFLMDIIWEITLALPLLALCWPMLHTRLEKWAIGVLTFIYVMMDFWQTISYLIWGDAILWEGSGYILSDPAIYVPIILIVILSFYIILLRNLYVHQASEKADITLEENAA